MSQLCCLFFLTPLICRPTRAPFHLPPCCFHTPRTWRRAPPAPRFSPLTGVQAGGGEALVFSSLHVSGEQLNQLSGIAALLRFPLPELEDQDIEPPPDT